MEKEAHFRTAFFISCTLSLYQTVNKTHKSSSAFGGDDPLFNVELQLDSLLPRSHLNVLYTILNYEGNPLS